ncbi:MAG: hypothetical protein FWD73_04645 [Polyangiaceae bacterium]|nr:hypothetical protein [Polyangiaceae bacterium]
MAVGDATSDEAPLQVGQFETTAELMDQWLTWTFLRDRRRAGGVCVHYARTRHRTAKSEDRSAAPQRANEKRRRPIKSGLRHHSPGVNVIG